MDYDYIIVGGGPSGLTLSLYLAEMGRKCLLVDKNDSLGGCHRVTRTPSGEFTEHGPRIYSSAYTNVKSILAKLETSWDETFTPYRFNISDIGGTSFSNLTMREKFFFFIEFVKLLFGVQKRDLSVGEFADSHNFSSSSKDYIDRICRLTDGAGSDRYTLFQFLQLLNENFFQKLYQPKKPNDQFLFRLWDEKLKNLGVSVQKSTNALAVVGHTLITDKGHFTGKTILVCIPPKPFLSLVSLSPHLKPVLEGIKSLVEKNSYIIDIPITFHWKKINVYLPKVWGFPRDDWAVAFIILSDYMKVEDDYSFVISTCITRVNAKSSKTGKTAMESTEEEMKMEVFRQLKLSFPSLPPYDKAILHKTTLTEEDTAFVQTFNGGFFPDKINENLYYIGTQNGNSYYSFTSMESAVTNSLFALRKLEPKLTHIPIRKSVTLIDVLQLSLLVILLVIIWMRIKKS